MKDFFQNSVCSRQWAVCSFQLAVCSLFKGLKVLLPANCLLFCCLLFYCQLSTAQIFPVQVTPQVLPPYSFRLSDYATSTREKLFVNLLLTDAMESGRRVRLRMNVEGPGISFRTVDFVAGAAPIVLNGGVNLRLSNFDLRPYFELNNLIGISPQQYGQQLPEGQYRFCFEVYDQFSGQRISNNSCANIYLQLNDPPLLNVPFRGDVVTAQQPQNLIFNWTPRHINAPGVQYEFTLKELWDTGMDPQASFFAAPPLYQTTTFANTLHYGPAQTPLLEGRTYGWQVRAFVSDGFTETSLFRNNGMSEVYHFTYRADCHPPRFVLSEAQNARTVRITWQMGEQLRYRVQYRKKGYGDGDWFGLWSRTNEAIIRNLEPGTVYEFRVGGDCVPLSVSPGGGEGSGDGLSFSPIHEFTTPTADEMAYYNCGIPPEIEIGNQEPLLNLGVNEVFTAGDFPVVVRAAMGSNGYYTGWGYITLPFLESIKEVIDVANVVSGGDVNLGQFSRIRVEFENIKINTDYQLVDGMVETSYDAEWSGIVDVDQAIADIKMTLAQLVELLSNIGIDSATRENIKTLTEMLVQQAQEELPQPIAEKLQSATEKMDTAKEQYDSAIASGNQELANHAKNDFKAAQNELKDAEKERDDFLKAYASIIKDALKEIVRESEDNLNNGLIQFGEESIVVTETGEIMELNASGLDQLTNALQPVAATTSEQDLLQHFEYERWQMLNYISTNLQTDEGTQELGNLLENEGEKLGIYIYNRLEENVKRSELIFEVKEILIETITEKIALSTKLF
ncbi:MAG: fibronectin type III domain-containing protein [Allomuricauda sp.]